MKQLITPALKLKAEAYQYQVKRFGNYRPQKPLSKAIARASNSKSAQLLASAHPRAHAGSTIFQ